MYENNYYKTYYLQEAIEFVTKLIDASDATVVLVFPVFNKFNWVTEEQTGAGVSTNNKKIM